MVDHVIGGPLAFASSEYARKAWVKYKDIPALQAKNIHVIQGSAHNVDCERKIATITDSISGATTREDYDFLVVATGLRRNFPAVPQSLTKKAYLYEADNHLEKVKNATEGVVVVGGGMYSSSIKFSLDIRADDPQALSVSRCQPSSNSSTPPRKSHSSNPAPSSSLPSPYQTSSKTESHSLFKNKV